MSQINLKFAELHNALFIAGTNLQMKLDPGKRTGLKLVYDRQEKELLVYWQDEVGIIPSSNVACMVAGEVKQKPVQISHPMVAGVASAQVSTPYGHVQAGPGHGKTGKDK